MFLLLILPMLSFTVPTETASSTSDDDFAVSLRFYNKDSKDHKFKVKICGSTKTVEFRRSRTSTITIQGSCREAVIYTDCGEVTVKDDQRIIIKDGCIKID